MSIDGSWELELSLLSVPEIVATWEETIPALTKKPVDSRISNLSVVIRANLVVTPSGQSVTDELGAFKYVTVNERFDAVKC